MDQLVGPEIDEEQDDGFVALYRRLAGPLTRLAVLLVDRHDLAEEVVHDAFARLYERWGSVEDPTSYVRAAVVNRSRDVLRRRRLTRTRPVPVTDVATHDRPSLLRDAIQSLPSRQRAVVVLRFYEDQSVPQIARLLRAPEGTVKSDLHRAMATLRKELES